MDKSVANAESVQPDTRPCCQVIPSERLVVSYRKSDEGELVHQIRNVLELQFLPTHVQVASTVRTRPFLVLALSLVPISLALKVLSELLCFAAVDMELHLDVRLEARGTGITQRQRKILRCKERDAEIQLSAADNFGLGLRLECRSVT